MWSALPLERDSLIADDVERLPAAKNSDDDADHQPDVAGAGGEERLERGVGVRLLLPPVPDQHERAEADELPADEQLQRVRRDDQLSIDAVKRLSAA